MEKEWDEMVKSGCTESHKVCVLFSQKAGLGICWEGGKGRPEGNDLSAMGNGVASK